MTGTQARGANKTNTAAALATALEQRAALLEQQTAVAEVLKSISASGFDLGRVLQTVTEHATRLSGATQGILYRREGEVLHFAAGFGPSLELMELNRRNPIAVGNRGTLSGRVATDKRTIHLADVLQDPEYTYHEAQRLGGFRAMLGVPLMSGDELLGTMSFWRTEPLPFSDGHIAIVETFARQAALAIQNVRLFNETKEALERQTAIGEILRVMSNSPTDVQPVLDAIAKSASEFCAAPDVLVNLLDSGDQNRIRAHHGNLAMVHQDEGGPFTDRSVSGRAMLERRTIHLQDLQAEATRYPGGAAASPTTRAISASPLLRMGRPIGAIILRRSEATPFTERQIELAETFADQAAIAIENVRLFNETKESLDRQTALVEILRVIASSPSDQQPVFDAIAINATRYCGAEDAVVLLVQGDEIWWVAHHGPILTTNTNPNPSFLRTSVIGRAILDGHTVHVADITGPAGDEFPSARLRAAEVGDRGILATPLLREATAIGAILLRKMDTSGFTPSQIQLVEAFADQAVIAIENVRLFKETKEALERQTAISEILRAIAKSPSDELPVLQTIAESATRFCGAGDATVLIISGDELFRVAHHGPIPTSESTPLKFDRTALSARAMMELRTLHVSDILGPDGDEYPQARARHETTKQRALLAAPLVREGAAIGAILLRKLEPVAFTPNQIALVEAFADQAVIAIENVRLFNETKEALKQRTATSEILRVISETLGDPQPVMQAIVDTVLGVCAADSAGFFRRAGDDLILRAVSGAWRGPGPSGIGHELAFHGDSIVVLALEEGRYQHVADTSADPRYDAAAQWSRTRLAVPVLRGAESLGVIRVGRTAPGGFSEREIHLVEGFAEQAAIAFENARLFNETKEALERQTALSEILSAISASPTEAQPVFEAIARNAARYCVAEDAIVALVHGNRLRIDAHHGPVAVKPELYEWQLDRSTVSGRSIVDRMVVQVEDLQADEADFPLGRTQARELGYRTTLAAPLLRKGEPIGALLLRRLQVRPFAPRQVELLRAFADQAVIAIENVRLFNETKEALEQQTAVGEVLKTISRSAFDLQPVLQTVMENATRICGADIGWMSRVDDKLYELVAFSRDFPDDVRAELEEAPEGRRVRRYASRSIDRPGIMPRVIADRKTIHISDIHVDTELQASIIARKTKSRSVLGVPMLREGKPIGAMVLSRYDVRPFTEREVTLVEMFADQAAIAIENVRLFDETKESLERQSAVSEVLKTISRTVFELAPTLQTVVENAARLCDADVAWMTQRVGDARGQIFYGAPHVGARWARTPELLGRFSTDVIRSSPADPRSIMGRTYLERRTIALDDITTEKDLDHAWTAFAVGARSVLAVPVLRDDETLGVIILARTAIRPFAAREVELVETFADQAAIAIQNVRLFNEIQEKSRQLEVASRHKSEFLANMSHELRTPLNAIIGFSEVLIQGLFGDVNEKQREYLQDVIGSGQHLLSLINDILDLSKIEAGRMDLELSTFSFRDALESGVTILRERASRHNITVSVVVSDELGQLEADERKVKQILYNLLTNAVKFTADGGRVDVSARRDNGDVRVDVQDNGIGIAEADQARIFEEFQQVGRERSREGTGLGLTLTKRFVELHGGRIWLESAPGRGSTFAFTLPLRQASPVRA